MTDFLNLSARNTDQLIKDLHSARERKFDVMVHIEAIIKELARRGVYWRTMYTPLEDRSLRITISCDGFEPITLKPINPEV